jgi:hypothetical protein
MPTRQYVESYRANLSSTPTYWGVHPYYWGELGQAERAKWLTHQGMGFHTTRGYTFAPEHVFYYSFLLGDKRWNGSEWSLITPPLPSGAASATLVSLSCSSSIACTAVGTAIPGPPGEGSVTLAERYE